MIAHTTPSSGTTAPAPPAPAATILRHGRFEDLFSLLLGALVVSFGLFVLRSGGAVTGGTAGVALLLSYAFPIPFGVLFGAVNLPFFIIAVRGKGWSFTLKSAAAIILVSALATLHPSAIGFGVVELSPVYAAVLGNILCGVGLLILFRHGSSLGGFNIVALILQDRFGLRAGYVLMALDTLVIVSALAVVSPTTALVSGVGAVLLNLILALNHRSGRYLGSSTGVRPEGRRES